MSVLWGMAEPAFDESLESCGRVCVSAFGRNMALVVVKTFSHLIYSIYFVFSVIFANITLQ
jgi:hypothetical protein